MIHIAISLSILAIGALSLTVITLMLKQNEAAIRSALLGRGAFPVKLSPDTGPAARLSIVPRGKGRPAPRRLHGNRAPQWSHAA